MFNRHKHNVKAQYDEFLVDSIDQAKSEWDRTKETEEAVSDVDEEVSSQTILARRKYFYLYQEARIRNVHSNRFQTSVFDD